MKNKVQIIISLVVGLLVLIGISSFLHYEFGYLPRVTINDTYLGSVTYKDINKYIIKVLKEDDYVFDNKDLDSSTVVYEFATNNSIENSNYVDYLKCLLLGGKYNFEILKTIDSEKVITWVNEYNKDATMPIDAYIEKGDTFYIVPEVYGTALDINKILDKLTPYKYEHLELDNFLLSPSVTELSLLEICNKANDYATWYCEYDNGKIIKSSINYVYIDDKIGVVYDDSFIDNELSDIVASYNNKPESFSFTTTNKKDITVENITLESLVDIESETVYLKGAMKNLEILENRQPIYIRDFREIGNTYIEVSINDQHLWYYKDGNLVLDCAVVTGTQGVHDTPIGCYYITEMINGKYLTGPGYRTWVNRWMRLNNNGIGLHDATWRSSFGGSIFLKDGSHGCVNMPNEKAAQLFKEAEIGTITVIY